MDSEKGRRVYRHRVFTRVWHWLNLLCLAVLLASGEVIGAEAIELGGPAEARQMMNAAVAAAPRTPAAPPAAGEGVASLVGRTVGDVERDLILETLTHCLGNRTHAATILGISIRTLRNKLREYSDSGLRVPPPQAGDLRAMGLSERLSA